MQDFHARFPGVSLNHRSHLYIQNGSNQLSDISFDEERSIAEQRNRMINDEVKIILCV